MRDRVPCAVCRVPRAERRVPRAVCRTAGAVCAGAERRVPCVRVQHGVPCGMPPAILLPARALFAHAAEIACARANSDHVSEE